MLALRDATPDDVPAILQLIRELAEYEREPDAVEATEDGLLRDGFGADPRFHVVIAELDGELAGMAFWFLNYSTWQGTDGIYLEDLYVRPRFRGRGVGGALLTHVGRVARERGCGRVVLQVLDWNEPAIRFYRRMGAKTMREWRTMRFEGDALEALADDPDGRLTPR